MTTELKMQRVSNNGRLGYQKVGVGADVAAKRLRISYTGVYYGVTIYLTHIRVQLTDMKSGSKLTARIH